MTYAGELPPGKLLGGCRIVNFIARGGMGEVYLAEHQVLQKLVAIKTVRPNISDERLARERFLKEARLAAKVEHPNVVTIYDAGDLDGLLYIVMQYVEGHDLSEILKSAQAPLEWRTVMAWMREACRGLEAVHKRGLIHRDIKPHNLMLTTDDRLIVMDFGLVREEDPNASASSGIVGTPYYMSPEQCRSERLDHRTDLYSLGATAYNLLAGVPPFQEKSVHLVIMKLAQNVAAKRIDSVRPDVPPELARLIAWTMAPERQQRISDARTLRMEIEGLLVPASVPVGRSTDSSRLSPPEQPPPRPQAVRPISAVETHTPSVIDTRAQELITELEEHHFLAAAPAKASDVRVPPKGLWQILRATGPSRIAAASVIVSGETLLANAVAYDFGSAHLIYVIVGACLLKAFLQIEIGRRVILSGQPPLAALGSSRISRWAVQLFKWAWLLLLLPFVIQLAGRIRVMVDGLCAYVEMPRFVWAGIIAVVAIGLVRSYAVLERLSKWMATVCAVLIFAGACAIAISAVDPRSHNVVDPNGAYWFLLCILCFTLGVGVWELTYFPYWCLEKGYARWTGPRVDDTEWAHRANGWIRVMAADVWIGTTLIAIVLASLTFLGDLGVLRWANLRSYPEMFLKFEYQEWALPFLSVLLLMKILACADGHGRWMASFFDRHQAGSTPSTEFQRRWRWRWGIVTVLLAFAVYLFSGHLEFRLRSPENLLVYGGLPQIVLLPMVAWMAWISRFRSADRQLGRSRIVDCGVIVAAVAITALSFGLGYYMVQIMLGR